MSFIDSILVSVFGMGVVFAVLIALSAIVVIQSKIVGAFMKKNSAKAAVNDVSAPVVEPLLDKGITPGQMKLIGVDEKTAALIMAIVSDESKIDLSELQFKSIKVMD